MTPCPECIDGKGLVTLFSSVRPCRTCAARRAETAAVVPVTGGIRYFTGANDWSDPAAWVAKVNAGPWPPVQTVTVEYGPSPFAVAFDVFLWMQESEAALLRSFGVPKSVLEPPPWPPAKDGAGLLGAGLFVRL